MPEPNFSAESQHVPYGKSLIIHADDWGVHPAVNEAVQALFLRNAITSASVLAGGAVAEEACTFANHHSGLCVGVHLSLATDIPPISGAEDIPSLLTGNSPVFSPLPALEQTAQDEEVFHELRQQIVFLLNRHVHVSHLDCHQGCVLGLHTGHDRWMDYIWRLCRELAMPFKLPRGIIHALEFSPVFRQRMARHLQLADSLGLPLIDDLIVPPFRLLPGEEYSTYKRQILDALRRIQPGTTVELTLHPALPGRKLKQADSHWIKREWEYRLCLDEDFTETLDKEQIRLTSWRELGRQPRE